MLNFKKVNGKFVGHSQLTECGDFETNIHACVMAHNVESED